MRIDNPSVSGSISFLTGNNTINSDTANITGSFSGSFTGVFEGGFSTAATLAISGAFVQDSSSLASRVADLESFEANIDNTYATDAQVATAVSGLNAATSSYLQNTTDTLTGDLTVTGTITAQEFHTEFVSASIIYQSGSTKFGNTSDDVHNFTGSVNISSTATISGDILSDSSAFTFGTVSDTNLELATSANANPRMLFRVNGSSERMRIDESGNLQVGISSLTGSADPRVTVGAKGYYHPNNGNGLGDFHIGDGNYGLSIGAALGGAGAGDTRIWTTGGTHKLLFLTNDTDYRLSINSSGNIGIGLYDAAYKLDVVGFSRFNNGFYLQEATAGTNAAFYLNSDHTLELEAFGATGAIAFSVGSSITEAVRIGTDAQTTFYNNIRFGTGDGVDWKIVGNANGPLIKLRRNSATTDRYGILGWRDNGSGEDDTIKWVGTTVTMPGKLGIGTSNPGTNLLSIRGYGAIDSNANQGLVLSSNHYYDSGDKYIGNGYGSIISQDTGGTYAGYIRFQQAGLNSSGAGATMTLTDSMVIDESGNVGIGTTSPRAKGLEIYRAAGQSSYPQLIISTGESSSKNYSISTDVVGAGDLAIIDGETVVGANARLLINSAGNVGIGTTSPTQPLHIDGGASAVNQGIPASSGTSQNGILRLTPGDAVYGETLDFGMNVATTYGWIQATNRDNLATTYNLALNPNGGKVGIGTTTPSVSPAVNTGLHVNNNNYIQLRVSSTVNSAGIEFIPYNGGSAHNYEVQAGSAGDWFVYDRTASSYRLNILPTGNVGIGTTSPTRNLQVHSATTTKFLVSTSGTADAYIEVQGYDAGLHIGDYTNGNRYAIWNDGVSTTSTLNFGSYALGTWYAPGSQIMTMTHNGNVGIGTMSPAAKLDINGSVKYRGDIVNNDSFIASGNYSSGTWYDVTDTSQLTENGIYILQCYVDTYGVGGSIYFMWFCSVPFMWVTTASNDQTVQNFPTVLGTGHAQNGITPPSFRRVLTSGATDSKVYIQFNPEANWTGINNNSGRAFRVYFKRIGG